ncbi:MAG TPA: serine/threonine-protein kinase [Bryobacteraceae bacterium]|nr:serine/threonine-protein kinase [Bryobacteraceae bacterium]
MSALNANIGEYRLVDFIGAGGMGEVYRAVHTRLGREIAIKILNQVEERAIERFQNEVRIQSSLRHPAIAEYYGMHEFRGRPCLLMELVDGETLADRIRTRGALPPASACAILRQAAEAVGYVHSQGIVHRDLKANNIKINSAGRVKLLDFGIARLTRGSHLTRAGMLIGTLENLAPEQVSGGEAGVRSDIWALGVLLYEMVTARVPFESESLPELYERIRSAEYTAPSALNPEVTPALEQVIAGCLRKKPALRFQSAGALIRALDAVPCGVVSPGKTQHPHASSGRWLLVGGAAVVFVALALIFLSGGRSDNPQKRTSSQIVANTDNLKTITVDTLDGPADVYQDGKRVGATPYQVQAAMGKRIDLELRRSGYKNQEVEFDVTERTTYSYAMDLEK